MGPGVPSGEGTGSPVANRLRGRSRQSGPLGQGAGRAPERRGGAEFLPGFLGPAARPPPERLGSSRPRVHSHGRTLSHTGTPPLVHRVTHTLRVAHTLPLLDRAVSRTRSMLHSRSVSDAHLFPRTLDGPLARALHPPGEARQLSHIRCFSQLGHMPRTSHVPFLTAGLSHSHTVSDPHTRWQGFPRRHTRAASLAARSRSPRTSSRRHSPPQTSTHTEPPAVPGCPPGT